MGPDMQIIHHVESATAQLQQVNSLDPTCLHLAVKGLPYVEFVFILIYQNNGQGRI
jgi:hypothetical protein